jgi:hypothetical protein
MFPSMIDPASLAAIAKSTKTITDFVNSAALGDAISMIVGDNALDAAQFAMNMREISTDPNARIRSAISHLETAHASFAGIHSPRGGKLAKYIKSRTNYGGMFIAADKDAWTCALMSLCYVELREKRASQFCLEAAANACRLRAELPTEPFDSPKGWEILSLSATSTSIKSMTKTLGLYAKAASLANPHNRKVVDHSRREERSRPYKLLMSNDGFEEFRRNLTMSHQELAG